MKSRSMYNGITKSFKIQKNDKIVLNNSINKSRSTNQEKIQKLILSDNIECYKGPEFHKLSKENKENLLKKQFSISNNHNRMGYILNEKIKNNIKPIITSHVMPGTVQLTPGGKIIILMRDCQTTGGYPRILQLTNSAINILSQKMTNSEIKFNIK
jgi:allophanate hydrolase subunit 2